MIAPFTVILLQLNYLVAGLVVVEMVFAYPGFGRMMLEAALAKDIAVVEAGTLVAVFVTMLTQIVGDLGYMRARPEDHGYDARPARPSGRTLPSTPRNRGSAAALRGTLRRVWAVAHRVARRQPRRLRSSLFWVAVRRARAVDRALSAEPDRSDGAGRPVPVGARTGWAPTSSAATSCRASSGAPAPC